MSNDCTILWFIILFLLLFCDQGYDYDRNTKEEIKEYEDYEDEIGIE